MRQRYDFCLLSAAKIIKSCRQATRDDRHARHTALNSSYITRGNKNSSTISRKSLGSRTSSSKV